MQSASTEAFPPLRKFDFLYTHAFSTNFITHIQHGIPTTVSPLTLDQDRRADKRTDVVCPLGVARLNSCTPTVGRMAVGSVCAACQAVHVAERRTACRCSHNVTVSKAGNKLNKTVMLRLIEYSNSQTFYQHNLPGLRFISFNGPLHS
jgi:hypothetical protein